MKKVFPIYSDDGILIGQRTVIVVEEGEEALPQVQEAGLTFPERIFGMSISTYFLIAVAALIFLLTKESWRK